MKILNVTTVSEWRGGDAQMYTVFKLLLKYTDLKQFIICPHNSVLKEKCKLDGNKEFCFEYHKKNNIRSLIKPLIELVNKQDIDVIHVHDSSALSAAIIAQFFYSKKTKLVYSRKRNNLIKNIFYKKIKYNNKYIDRIICVSKAVEQVFYNIGTPKNKLVTIYDAIDVQKFSNKTPNNILDNELSLPQATKLIGNIASLTHQKDIPTFLKVAKKIIQNNNNIHFIIIGDGPLKEELKSFCHQLNITDNIHFLGFRSDVQEILPELDLLLMTSITEGLPLSIYEAMAAKVPIVSTKAGGIPEVIKDGETGFCTEIGDIDELAKKSILLLQNNELKNIIIENGYTLVSKSFDLKIIEENYLNFYLSLKY